MDQQKMEQINTFIKMPKQSFPLVEAMLLEPPEGGKGEIGICTNTSAPGQIINEIPESLRSHLTVLGSLIVSRDGGERMIINSLAHPTLKYLILFSEESTTFAPSTNLLLALLDGFETEKGGNYIKGGVAASSHYPNINEKIFELFKNEIVVIPAFMGKHAKSKQTVERYLEFLKPKISPELHTLLVEINQKEKIYFDSLKKILEIISSLPQKEKAEVPLDPQDFQHLQPPKIELDPLDIKFSVSFRVQKENKGMRLDLNLGDYSLNFVGDNSFSIAYSLMKYLGEQKRSISPIDQLVLGAELGRVENEIMNDIKFPPFVAQNHIVGNTRVELEPSMSLVMDKRYYYKINTKGNKISAMCLSFDVCESVFELLTPSLPAMIERIARENRFEDYEMDILHRIDIGIQLGRASIAATLGYSFIQDFSAIFKINKEILPSIIVEGESFLDVHKSVLRSIYTKGITEEHGDPWKGLARSASVLAIYRSASKALETMPALYQQSDQDTKTMRSKYRCELLRRDHDGTYTYGERTRAYFGFDQLINTIKVLRKDPNKAALIQRFDPSTDMSTHIDPDTGKMKFSHDPCLTHDIFWIQGGKLHSFHIARAHNAVNAYPENIFGLFDAYVKNVSKNLQNIEIGDMYMLSNRANILLLTEEQRTKKILGEPSKPSFEIDKVSGPYELDKNIKSPDTEGGVAYSHGDMQRVDRTTHPVLRRLENYRGTNAVKKAINYLKEKGIMHNNPVLTEYFAGENDPQADQLSFFQANVFGGKVYATAVFMNRSISNLEKDKELVNHLGTLHSQKLNAKLGTIDIYYVAYSK